MPDISNDAYYRSATPKLSRTSAFISYSPKDQAYLRELQNHLAYYIRKWNLEVWDDTKIRPGAKWHEEIDKALQSAKVAVLLVSPDFLASERIMGKELQVLLTLAREERVIILCVNLRTSAFENSELAQFQAVNAPSNPLSKMTRAQRDEIWREVAEFLRKTLSQDKEENGSKQTSASVTTESAHLNTPRDTSFPHILSHEDRGVTDILSTRKRAMSSSRRVCDICVICAMDEEVQAFIHEAMHLCNVTFHSVSGPRTMREYRYTTIHNNKGEPLTVFITWPPSYGPEETALHFKSALDELKPRFAAMTGICAGDKKKVALGDIIVAERAFRYDTGKIVLGKRGRKVLQYDTRTQNLDPNILHFVRLFDGWKSAVKDLKGPISKHQQRDWLLSSLLKDTTPRIDNIPLEWLEQHSPDWKKIVYELQSGSPRYLNDDRSLCDPARVRELYFSKEVFPFQDLEQPRCYIAPMASGGVVRGDNPFEEIRTPVRGTIAIDMEGATFYRTVAEFPDTRSLLVKGVCDYADPDKDDSYHEYAAAVSAIYMLNFIKEYVNDDRLPRL